MQIICSSTRRLASLRFPAVQISRSTLSTRPSPIVVDDATPTIDQSEPTSSSTTPGQQKIPIERSSMSTSSAKPLPPGLYQAAQPHPVSMVRGIRFEDEPLRSGRDESEPLAEAMAWRRVQLEANAFHHQFWRAHNELLERRLREWKVDEKDPEAMARFYRHWQRDTGAMMRDYQWTWYRMNVHMLAVEWRAVVTRWRATVANIFRRRR